MKKQDLKLNYIECGRISDNDMNGILGGGIQCDIYTVCNKEGKSSCSEYYNCKDLTDWTKYHKCNIFSWLAEGESINQC